jgi:hypothetical protein
MVGDYIREIARVAQRCDAVLISIMSDRENKVDCVVMRRAK